MTNEVHCFNGGAPGEPNKNLWIPIFFLYAGLSCDKKLQIAGLSTYALSNGKPPYKVVVYVPGSKVAHT